MPLRAVLASLPEEYEVLRGQRGVLAVERTAREVLLGCGFGPDGGEGLPPSDLAGRGALGALDARDERWIVRRFHHGGLLRFLGERLFIAPARPFQELALACDLRSAGLPTPRVVAARALRAGPVGWRLALVSARIEGASDAAEWLERLRRDELGPRDRARLMAAVGELVGRLHAARFLHADLHARNVLVARDLGTAWILDLDRGRGLRELPDHRRRDNLRRLYRSVRRREARGRRFLRRADYLRFLRAYGRVRGVEAAWREDWRAIVARDRAFAPFHRLGWFLEELLGDGPERRDGTAIVR